MLPSFEVLNNADIISVVLVLELSDLFHRCMVAFIPCSHALSGLQFQNWSHLLLALHR